MQNGKLWNSLREVLWLGDAQRCCAQSGAQDCWWIEERGKTEKQQEATPRIVALQVGC
jgi:hypothetical protein